jgi:arabinose operon protein AraL
MNREQHAFGYLLDLDGTVYRGDRLLPGSDSAIAELRARGRRIAFVSNKPLHSRQDYAMKLTKLGIPATESDVIHSSYILARYLSASTPNAKVYAIGEPPLLEQLRSAGIELCEDPHQIEVVVVGFDRTLTYQKLNLAFQALLRGARFLATNADLTCPTEDGEIPDAGASIAALEAATGRRVEEVLGKPSVHTVRAALELLRLPAARCAMVGDRLETDIVMAEKNGLVSILTLTGVTSRVALQSSPIQPDFVIESLADLPTLDSELQQCAEERIGSPE